MLEFNYKKRKPDVQFYKHLVKNFLGDQQGFFVECGAYDGYGGSVCYLLEKDRGWQGINVECNPRLFSILKKNRPNSINSNCALSDSDGKKLNFRWVSRSDWLKKGGFPNDFDGGGSLEDRERRGEVAQHTVETITLKSLTNNVSEIDLMVLDVEGHECSALAGFKGSVLPKILCVEDNHIDADQLKAAYEILGYKQVGRYQNNIILRN